MPRLHVDHISVRFPVYSRAQMLAHQGQTSDNRVITDARGRIKAIQALSDIAFELNRGDRLGLVGRNGSGKTTLLQVLAQILIPDDGQVIVDGTATNLLNINLGIQPGANAQRNITLRGLAAGHTREEIEARRQQIIDFSELGDFIEMPVETYSSGMRMRLSFAIATAFQPEILILDEWLSTGDIAFRAKATARMNDFVGQAGILVLASHSKKLLMDNCNQAIWLEDGRIKASGNVEDIWNAYEETQKREAQEVITATTATLGSA